MRVPLEYLGRCREDFGGVEGRVSVGGDLQGLVGGRVGDGEYAGYNTGFRKGARGRAKV